jgi:hypothetical protein
VGEGMAKRGRPRKMKDEAAKNAVGRPKGSIKKPVKFDNAVIIMNWHHLMVNFPHMTQKEKKEFLRDELIVSEKKRLSIAKIEKAIARYNKMQKDGTLFFVDDGGREAAFIEKDDLKRMERRQKLGFNPFLGFTVYEKKADGSVTVIYQ